VDDGLCANCSVSMSDYRLFVGNLCHRCYTYERRNKRPRPKIQGTLRPWAKHGLATGLCRNCKLKLVYSRNLCKSCYTYKYSKKKGDRPYNLFRENCRTCLKPFQKGDQRSHGECSTCARYRDRHHRTRPKSLIEKHSPLGWCDCGNPAVIILKVPRPFHQHHGDYTDDLGLCALHLKEESVELYEQYSRGDLVRTD